ncbi:MAG: hypothetical protein J6T01_04980 [Kiritimatiellae bacterium]|nr:hypothetical protein [Kiritimatiellia bacterium]
MTALRAAVCGVAAVFAAAVQAVDVAEISFDVAMPAKTPPKIDGALDDACWKDAMPHTVYYEYIKPRPKHKFEGTSAAIMYDDAGLYVGVCNPESQPGNLRQRARKSGDNAIETDDIGEIYLDPVGDAVGFYKFMVNSLGVCSTLWRMDPNNPQPAWKPDGIKSAAKIFSDRWEFELFIPWAALHGRAKVRPGEVWRFNHSRFRFTERGWGDFGASAVMASFFSANRFGYLQFSDGAKPAAATILKMIEKRVPGYWAVGIGGKSYLHDEDGTREISKTIQETLDEIAAADKAETDAALTNIVRMATMEKPLPPKKLRLAGTYDLNPPKEYDGHNGWFRWNPSQTAYVTPHLKWCEKSLGGAAKVLCITGTGPWVRDAVEVCQRCDFKVDVFPMPFGYSSIFADLVTGGLPLPRYRQFETMLAKNPEVIVLHYTYPSGIPAVYRCEIVRRVHDEGVGLVLRGSRVGRDLVPDEKYLEPDEEGRRILSAAGLSPKAVRAYRYGRGRVVCIDVPVPEFWNFAWRANYETRSTYFMNAARYAAGRNPASTVKFAQAAGVAEPLPLGTELYPFTVEAAPRGACDSVKYRVRSSDNELLVDETAPVKAGRNVFAVDISGYSGGDYYVDVVPGSGGCDDFASVRKFTVQSPVGAMTVNGTNRMVVAEGCRFDTVIAWEKPVPRGEKWTVDVLLRDMPYRQVRARCKIPVGGGARSVRYQIAAKPFPTKAGCVDVTLRKADGGAAAKVKKLVFFPTHRFEDYAMICWDGIGPGNLAELFAPPLMDEIGYNNHLSSGSLSAIFNGRALPYSTRVCLAAGPSGTVWTTQCPIPKSSRGDPEIKQWWDANGHDLNVHRPAVRERLARFYNKRIDATLPYGPLAWSFGDECGYSSDIGFGDAESEGYYRDYLKKRYGTLAAYNRAHGTNIADFAEAPHVRVKASRAANDWVTWYDQVQYAEHLYADTFHELTAIIKKRDPKARCGAEGSPGADIEYTLSKLEFWGPYGNKVDDELVRNIAPRCLRGIWWGGYQRSPRDGFAAEQWGYVLCGTLNADLWFQMDPASAESGMSSDFQPAPYVKRMLPTWRPLSRGIGALLCRVPMRKSAFAIYYSHASNHASTLSDDFPSAREGNGAFIDYCYRNGMDTAIVTRRSLCRLDEMKALFLSGAVALDDGETAALAKFAKRGGKIYSDCEPGVLDGYLARREKPPLSGLWKELKRGWKDDRITALLAESGITVKEKLSGISTDGVKFRIRELGDMTLLGFVTSTYNLGKRAEIELGEEKWVYESDVGFIGRSDRITIARLEKPHALYAAFKTEQRPPEVRLTKTEIAPGDEISLDTAVLRKGSVYRLETESPAGARIANRETLFCADRKTKVDFQFPYSDAPGRYKVVLRDMATGLESAAAVTLAAPVK